MVVRLQPAPPAPAPDESSRLRRRGERPSVLHWLAVVLARLPVLALAVGLPLALSYGLIKAVPPLYTANASIFADGETSNGRRTFLDLATARPVIERVARRPDLKADLATLGAQDAGAFLATLVDRIRGRAAPVDDRQLLARLEAAVTATPAAEANILTLSATAASPESAVRLADAVAAAFVEEAMALAKARNPPSPRAEALRKTLADAEAALAAARSQPAMPAPPRPIAAGPQPDWPALQRRFNDGGDVEEIARAIRSPGLERLSQDVADARTQEATLRTSLGARHPSVIEARQQLEERRQLLSEAVRLAIAAGRAGVSASIPAPSRAAGVDIATLEREVNQAQAAYDAFLRSPDGQTESRIARILRAAEVQPAPVFPPRRLIWGIGLGAALLFGSMVLAGLIRRLLVLRRQAGAAGAVSSGAVSTPAATGRSAFRAEADAGFADASGEPAATPGALAEELSTRAMTSALQSWTITGAEPDTIVSAAIDIAGEAARRHLRVLLLDGNERQPALSRRLRDAPVSGHIMLNGKRRALASFEPSRGAPVWLAPALSSLKSTRASDLPLVIPALAGHFDLLLIAAPEVGNGQETVALAAASEGVILAVRRGADLSIAAAAASLGIGAERLRRVAADTRPIRPSPDTPSPDRPSSGGSLIRLDLAG